MKVKGLDKLIKDLHKLGAVGINAIAETTLDAAKDIAGDAKLRAPKNNSTLSQSISFNPIDKFHYRIFADQKYAAFMEFGTGGKVNVPPEMQQVASQFHKKYPGTYEAGLQSFRDWARKHGIKDEDVEFVFWSILKNGLEPRPFLYPAFVKGRNQYYNDLKDELDRLTKI